MVSGIEHTAIASSDPEALARWYVDTLGFQVNYHSEKSRTTFVKAPDGGMIEMILASDRPRTEAGMRDPGLRHLALTVADFPAAYAKLQAKGVRFLAEPDLKGANRVVFFTDPDGNILHLLQRQKPI